MPGLINEAREQLLLRQFLIGLPSTVNKHLYSSGDTKALDTAVEAWFLVRIKKDHKQEGVAPISWEQRGSKLSEMMELNTQLIKLSEHVAVLTTVQSSKHHSRMSCCFICKRIGHFQWQCPNTHVSKPTTDSWQCFCCGQLGNIKEDCKVQGNNQGMRRAGCATEIPYKYKCIKIAYFG